MSKSMTTEAQSVYCQLSDDCLLAPGHDGPHEDEYGELVYCIRCGWRQREDDRETYCDWPDVSHKYPVKDASHG